MARSKQAMVALTSSVPVIPFDLFLNRSLANLALRGAGDGRGFVVAANETESSQQPV